MRNFTKLFVVVLVLSLPLVSLSQPLPDETPPCDGPFGGPCPIDGGVSFLIAAGIAFGGKKAYDIKNKG